MVRRKAAKKTTKEASRSDMRVHNAAGSTGLAETAESEIVWARL